MLSVDITAAATAAAAVVDVVTCLKHVTNVILNKPTTGDGDED